MTKTFRLQAVAVAVLVAGASTLAFAQAGKGTPPVATRGAFGIATGTAASAGTPSGGGAAGAPAGRAGGNGGSNVGTGNSGQGLGNRGLGNQGNTTPAGNTQGAILPN
jgi:hypothetical protein